MAPATEHPLAARSALIVAHGSPSSPGGPERAIRALAGEVAGGLPGWTVRGATLAAPGALEAALVALPAGSPLVFPFFMSDGWFVRSRLPQRAMAAAGEGGRQLRPLGDSPALRRLCLDHTRAACVEAGFAPDHTAVLIAAHGSPHDARAGRAAEAVVRHLAAAGTFREVRLGFIEQPPFLHAAARLAAPALCLPFFALQAGHVEIDLPQALQEAAFPGPQLPPIGGHPDVVQIVRTALRAGVSRRRAVTPCQDSESSAPRLPA